MAIQDASLKLASALDCAAATTTLSDSINVGSSGADVDHGDTAYNRGFGDLATKALILLVEVSTLFDGTSVQVEAIQATDSALTAGIEVLADTGVVVVANGPDTVGFKLMEIPMPRTTLEFFGLRITDTSGTSTTGAVNGVIQLQTAHGRGVVAISS